MNRTVDESLRDVYLKRIGSLPPHVIGLINGYLSLTIDDIKWRVVPRDVQVYVSWWGEKQQVVFIPQISQLHGSLETTYFYRIMTNTELFVSYLQDCEELNFEMCEQSTKFHLGTATLNNLVSIILYNPFKTTCVVTDKDGSEIADLTVAFTFHNYRAEHKEFGNSEPGVLNMIEKIQKIDFKEERGTDIGKKTCISHIPFSDFHQNKFDFLNTETKNSGVFSLNKNDDIVSNSTISELLEQSQSIRQEYYNYKKLGLIHSDYKTGEDNSSTESKIRDFLSGKMLSKQEECVALEAVKFKSEQELLLLAEDWNSEHAEKVLTDQLICSKSKQGEQSVQSQVFFSPNLTKDCKKCRKYIKESQNEEKRNEVREEYKSGFLCGSKEKESSAFCFRYLRLTIQTLSLNYVGKQRVLVSSRALTSNSQVYNSSHRRQLPPNIVYFVEYEIPQFLRACSSEPHGATKPWNCNLNRMCSRQKAGKCINFYRQMIHSLASHKPRFREFLCTSSITFKVYSRHLNQRLPCFIGEASLSLGKIVKSNAFSSLQELPILPQSQGNTSHMLSLGTLKLNVEFGSNRTCFELKQACSVVAQSLASSSESEYENEDIDTQSSKVLLKSSKIISKRPEVKLGRGKNITADAICRKNISSENFKKGKLKTDCKISRILDDKNEKILLFGLLHVSLGREIKASNTYLVSHGFWKEDVMTSDIHWRTENPIFRFHKIMPVLLTLELLDRCYNNFMVVEVWSQSNLIGIAKLPLNQFYVAYRDPPVVEQLLSAKYPIISTDGWVDVIDPVTQHQVGQLNVILALGTENQIQMLEMSRCLKEDVINSQTTLKSFSDYAISQSKPSSNTSGNEQNLKLKSGGSSQNEIDLNYNDEYSDKSTLFLELNNAISKEDLFDSYYCSESILQKSKNTSEEFYASERRVLQTSQNTNLLGANGLPVSFSESLVKCGSRREESARTSVNQEMDISSGIQFDHNNFIVPDGNFLQKNNHSMEKHSISQSHVKYVEEIDTDRDSEIQSPISSDIKQSPLSNIITNTFGERDNSIFHEENHYLSQNDEISSGGVVNVETSIIGNPKSNFLPSTSRDNNNEEHSTPVCKSVHISNDISTIITESHENTCNFVSKVRDVQECLPHYDNLTLADLDYSPEIIHDSKYQESREQNDCESIKSNDNSSFVALTENASTQTDILCSEFFVAMVEIINGLYIPKLDNGELPNSYVTFHIANNLVMSTSVIYENIDPVWNWSSEVRLPVTLLENNGRCLIFKIWHKSNHSEDSSFLEDCVIGFVAIDLRVLVCGLPSISGWFNINDLSGNCKGQIQVNITPLENVSQISNISEPKNKIDEKKNKGKCSISHVTMTQMLSADLQNSEERISHELVSDRNKTNFISQNGKEIVNILQIQERHPGSNDSEKQTLFKNILDFSVESNKPCTKTDSFSSKTYKTPLNNVNRMCFENQKSDTQNNCTLLDLHSSHTISTNKNCSTNIHQNSDTNHVSVLTQTLRQKFQELDEIIQQMKIRSKYRNTKLKTTVSENSLRRELKTNEDPCSELVDFVNKYGGVNFTERTEEHTESDGHIDLSSEKHISSRAPFFSTKNAIEKEMTKSQVSDLNTQLAQTSQNANSLATNTISPLCVKSNSRYSTVRCDGENKNSEISMPSNLMTDHLMCEALHEMDLENIFNPLLFQHIIANHQSKNCCSQWYNEFRENPFCFHKINHTNSLPSRRKETSLPKLHDNREILSGMSSKSDVSGYNKMDEPSVNNIHAKHFIACDSSPAFADGIIKGLRVSHNDDETFSSARPNSSCEYSSSSKHLKVQSSCNSQNSPKTNKNSAQRNSNESIDSSDVAFLRDMKSISPSDTGLLKIIQLSSELERQCVDQKILNTTLNDKSRNYEPLCKCRHELEKEKSIVGLEKNSATSLNEAVVLGSLEKNMLEDFGSEQSVTKLSGISSDSEKHAEKDKV